MNLDKPVDQDDGIPPEFIASTVATIFILGSTVMFAKSDKGLIGLLHFHQHSIFVTALIFVVTIALASFIFIDRFKIFKVNYLGMVVVHTTFLIAFIFSVLAIFSAVHLGFS